MKAPKSMSFPFGLNIYKECTLLRFDG